MGGVSRSAVGAAGFLLIAAAALGLYLGYSRASSEPGGSSGDSGFGVATTSVVAKTASPIPDSAPPPPVPDEAFIRKIAREEVQSALHPKRAAPTVADTDDSSDSSDDSDTDTHTSPPTANPPPSSPPSQPGPPPQ